MRSSVTAQRVRGAAVLLANLLVALSVYIAFFTKLPQIVVVLTFFAGLVPYLVSIKVIEPWLLRRSERSGADSR